jgi:hypothetical protein
MDRPDPPFEYLLECSKISLGNFTLLHLNKAAEARKAVNRLLDEWIEAAAMARFAGWLEAHGESMVALASAPPDRAKGEAEQLCIDFLGSDKVPELERRGDRKRPPLLRVADRRLRNLKNSG